MGVTPGGEDSGALPTDQTRHVTVIVNSDVQKVVDDCDGYIVRANGPLRQVKKVWCANQNVNMEDVMFHSLHRRHLATPCDVKHPKEVKDTDTPDSLGVGRELHLLAAPRPMARDKGGLCAVPFNP